MTADDFVVLNFNQDLAKELAKKRQHKLYHFLQQKKLMVLILMETHCTSKVKQS
ncbi:UDP-N-acetylmuramoylalanine-D-glutamate ligase [Streptococcus sp. HSISB1]|nr:UDP-N-acetylmuramoylalanine-D-glutamate ligase [Streptococcus sp. HSISB1]